MPEKMHAEAGESLLSRTQLLSRCRCRADPLGRGLLPSTHLLHLAACSSRAPCCCGEIVSRWAFPLQVFKAPGSRLPKEPGKKLHSTLRQSKPNARLSSCFSESFPANHPPALADPRVTPCRCWPKGAGGAAGQPCGAKVSQPSSSRLQQSSNHMLRNLCQVLVF